MKGKAMLIDYDRMIGVTRLQKELAKQVRELCDTGNPLYILKNSNIKAVMLSFTEYAYLRELEDMVEYFELDTRLTDRLASYDPEKGIPWRKLREQ